jgi:hypothetical protein
MNIVESTFWAMLCCMLCSCSPEIREKTRKLMADNVSKSFCLGLLCSVVLLLACERYDAQGHPMSFYSKPYSDFYCEFKRIPLAFPYEITDFHGDSNLMQWNCPPAVEVGPDMVLHILQFSQTNNHFFGVKDAAWDGKSGELIYFVFSAKDKTVVNFSDKAEFSRYCLSFCGDISQMRPFEEQWKTYWEQHEKQKK